LKKSVVGSEHPPDIYDIAAKAKNITRKIPFFSIFLKMIFAGQNDRVNSDAGPQKNLWLAQLKEQHKSIQTRFKDMRFFVNPFPKDPPEKKGEPDVFQTAH